MYYRKFREPKGLKWLQKKVFSYLETEKLNSAAMKELRKLAAALNDEIEEIEAIMIDILGVLLRKGASVIFSPQNEDIAISDPVLKFKMIYLWYILRKLYIYKQILSEYHATIQIKIEYGAKDIKDVHLNQLRHALKRIKLQHENLYKEMRENRSLYKSAAKEGLEEYLKSTAEEEFQKESKLVELDTQDAEDVLDPQKTIDIIKKLAIDVRYALEGKSSTESATESELSA